MKIKDHKKPMAWALSFTGTLIIIFSAIAAFIFFISAAFAYFAYCLGAAIVGIILLGFGEIIFYLSYISKIFEEKNGMAEHNTAGEQRPE